MKSLGRNIVIVINSVFAILLLLTYSLHILPPKLYALLSVLSLIVPVLIVINLLFAVYWLIRLKKYVFISAVVLVIGFLVFGSIYKFELREEEPLNANTNLSILNYNVRLFNLYEWLDHADVKTEIETFIQEQNADLVNLQEYYFENEASLKGYPYHYKKIKGEAIKYGQVIFSKFPIINSGSVEFPSSSNNAIFVDIVKHNDTIRVYNLHLQSLKINPDIESLRQEASMKLFKRVAESFKKQDYQTDMFMKHRNKSPYKTIVTGDFNNTSFSYVYNTIKGDMIDAFDAAGSGFGSTYDFKFFPLRIDFILVDKNLKVIRFNTFNKSLSDHFPIKTIIALKP